MREVHADQTTTAFSLLRFAVVQPPALGPGPPSGARAFQRYFPPSEVRTTFFGGQGSSIEASVVDLMIHLKRGVAQTWSDLNGLHFLAVGTNPPK